MLLCITLHIMKINYFTYLKVCFSLKCDAKFHTNMKEQMRLVLHRTTGGKRADRQEL
jgi:hypothetical protein